MAWSEERSRARIRKFIEDNPISRMRVQQFGEYYQDRSRQIIEDSQKGLNPRRDPILELSYNQAITTDGVHIYANLIDFNDTLTENQRETEASHERALQFLHLHYRACDELIRAFGIQRVDFHGGRLHAVVLAPEGPHREVERVQTAIAFAQSFIDMVRSQSDLFQSRYRTDVCIGIDSGKAVAINSGRKPEQEPLFVGSPANHAAKLAATDIPGIVPSNRVRQVAGILTAGRLMSAFDVTRLAKLALDFVDASGIKTELRVSEAADAFLSEQRSLSRSGSRPPSFTFHKHTPPLKSIDYNLLSASNSIRMGMASLFADLDGFTAYVDEAVRTNRIAQAVHDLHVIRREFVWCTRDDFGAKKVRFIGDCLHAISSQGDDDRSTAEDAIQIAAAIRSSFYVLKESLPSIRSLGLAIGLESGPTPVSRIGFRGEGSVRCSSSKATCASEELQSACDDGDMRVGPRALSAASLRYSNIFDADGYRNDLHYDELMSIVGGSTSAHISAEPHRSHLGS
ncbi:adenylate/guanylate cyclase domain-containing protein [Ponticaulis sp.]|uniref:adenylate/guanylate cyclase domain-containing protein n=1 Tax=Ponticaulis sp. TaxID=2020902 RepID=UPI00262DCF5A|nr:adenylate/guanylate cyclase domain-containing protein [Ponticaulis sp.]MDF1678932.1 adenylate/guanylate cyclase domain-containing protein [Ponticaulis sp.]